MPLRRGVSGQVAQGGCVQTHHVFGYEEPKTLSQSHSEGRVWAGREVFHLHWSHDGAGWDLASDSEQSSLCQQGRNRGDPQQGPCDLPHMKTEGIIAYKVCLGLMKASDLL